VPTGTPKTGYRIESMVMRKVKQGDIEPYHEKAVMNMLGVTKLKGA
jgi:hypothetical protein